MSNSINRRNFLKTSAVLAAAAATQNTLHANTVTPGKQQEYYEIRIYRSSNSDKKKIVENYLKKALIPALGRLDIDRIGVFINMDDQEDHSVFVLIPYSRIELFTAQIPKLQADKEYLTEAKEYFAAVIDDPVYSRIQSRFYKAFEGMPVIEMPSQTRENNPRIFELRIYESHTEEKAALKVDMFNSGEIQVMRDTGLAPVFFGEALIGDDLPNLTYMLSASDREAHGEHWEKFGNHPEWVRMRELPKYADTVSKITNYFLVPTAYSQI